MDSPWQQPAVISYSHFIASSFRHWTGNPLLDMLTPQALYFAPFVLVSHHNAADPVFRYANAAAQSLWDLNWDEFTALPSRLSAEADAQEERERLLALAKTKGVIDNYSGIRITSHGRRFRIKNCTLWNVLNDDKEKIGQAAMFSEWEFL